MRPEEQVVEARLRPAGDAVDLLLVVDASHTGMMQWSLSELIEAFLDRLPQAGDAGQTVGSLHVGLVSGDLGTRGYEVTCCDEQGDRGALLAVSTGRNCPATFEPHYLSASTLEPNDGGPDDPNGLSLSEELDCILDLGPEDDCPFQQTLEAMRLALTERVEDGTNAGFLRDGSVLAVILVSDAEDCSSPDPSFFDLGREDLARGEMRCIANRDALFPVERYVDTLAALRPAGRLATAGWITVPLEWDGSLEPLEIDPGLDPAEVEQEDVTLCTPGFDGPHYKAYRLADFLLRTDGAAWSNCSMYTPMDGLPALAETIRGLLDPRACLPERPAEGARCEVTLRRLEPGSGCPPGSTEVEARACALGDAAWSLVETEACAEVRPSADLSLEPGDALDVRCVSPAP